MNLNMYGYAGKWLMVDLGISFPDETMPGVEIIMADPTFAAERKADLVGLIIRETVTPLIDAQMTALQSETEQARRKLFWESARRSSPRGGVRDRDFNPLRIERPKTKRIADSCHLGRSAHAAAYCCSPAWGPPSPTRPAGRTLRFGQDYRVESRSSAGYT